MVLSELTDVTTRVIFVNMDNPDDWKNTNITVFKEKKKKARKGIQGTKHWSASPLSLRTLKSKFSFKLFLAM